MRKIKGIFLFLFLFYLILEIVFNISPYCFINHFKRYHHNIQPLVFTKIVLNEEVSRLIN